MFSMMRSLAVTVTVISFLTVALSRRLTEDERVTLWKQNNQWPPVWQPETEGTSSQIEALFRRHPLNQYYYSFSSMANLSE